MSRVIRRGLVGVVAATLATVGLAGTASSASADVDATAPTLALPAYPSFVVGTTVTASDKLDTGEFSDYNDYTYGIAQQVTWSAADASGVCSQAVAETGTGYDFGSTAVDAPAYRYSADDYDDSYGGGMGVSGVDVTVRDCAGNETVGHSGGQPAVYDERVATNRYGTLSYSGTWSTVVRKGTSGRSTKGTYGMGNKATFTRTYRDGEHVALVMPKGPQRGKAAILVDGVRVATVDTYAATRTDRVVVWERALTAGAHKVSVVNLATSGRPRVDLDAILVQPN